MWWTRRACVGWWLLCVPINQVIPSTYVNKAMERLVKNDVHFRFVIDIAGSLSPSSAEVDDL